MQSQIEVLSYTGCWFWCDFESVSVLQEVHVLWFNNIIWVWVCWSFQWLRCSVDSHKWLEIKCFGAVQETELILTSGWKSNVSKLFEYFKVLVSAWFVITLSCLTTFHFTLRCLPLCQLLVLGSFYSHMKLLPKSRHEQTRKKLEISFFDQSLQCDDVIKG